MKMKRIFDTFVNTQLIMHSHKKNTTRENTRNVVKEKLRDVPETICGECEHG
jgi:hypothetical protein